MNIFENANCQVVKHSTGIKELNKYNTITEGAASKEFISKMAVMEHCEAITESARISEIEYNTKKRISDVTMASLTESQKFTLIDKLSKDGEVAIFKNILFEMYNQSLLLDDDFKKEHAVALQETVSDYVDKNGGMMLLTEACKRSKSTYLSKIKKTCKETAATVAKRKLSECKDCDSENIKDVFKFDLNQEEEKALDKEKRDMSIEELSGLVQQKVLTVISEEKKREKAKKELDEDIEEQLIEDGDVKNKEDVKESLNKIKISLNPIEEATLFNSLMVHSYKEVLEATNSIMEYDEDKNKDLTDEAGYSEEDVSNSEHEDLTENEEISMDHVLAEAVAKYTLLELAHTINLESFDVNRVQKLTRNLRGV